MLTKLSKMERYDLFQVNTKYSVFELTDKQKMFLWAYLCEYGSCSKETDLQKEFFEHIKPILKTESNSKYVSLVEINNVSDLLVQKIYLQVLMEYDYLGSYYEDTFNEFSVNKADRIAIRESIYNIVRLVGPKGLIEKYDLQAADSKTKLQWQHDQPKIYQTEKSKIEAVIRESKDELLASKLNFAFNSQKINLNLLNQVITPRLELVFGGDEIHNSKIYLPIVPFDFRENDEIIFYLKNYRNDFVILSTGELYYHSMVKLNRNTPKPKRVEHNITITSPEIDMRGFEIRQFHETNVIKDILTRNGIENLIETASNEAPYDEAPNLEMSYRFDLRKVQRFDSVSGPSFYDESYLKVHFDDGTKLYLEADYADRATEHIDLIADILNKIVRAIKRT